MLRPSWTAFAIALLAMTSPAPKAHALGRKNSSPHKCQAAKLQAIGKKEAGLLACQAAVAKSNNAAGLAACETKVKGKFATAFGKAGTCSGDEATCEDLADICETTVAGAIPGPFPSKCAAAKRKAAGLYASASLACYAKAASSSTPVVAACLSKAAAKFATALGKAGACADGGGLQALVETVCVDAVVSTDVSGEVTDVCSTANSTTSTLSSSTTTPTSSTTTTTHVLICEAPNEIGCTDLTPGCFPCSASGGLCGQTCEHRCVFGFADGGACASCLADLCGPACCH